MKRATVYMITNTVSGERYVGVTAMSITIRWGQHKWKALNAPNTKFYHSLAKNGPEAFRVEAVATVLDAKDGSYVERQVIADRKPEYNMTNGGEHTVGRKLTTEAIERIRIGNTGKRRTPELRAALSAQRKQRIIDRPELRAKCAAALEDARLKIDEPKRLEAIRNAAAEGRMFNNRTPEQQAKWRANSHSPEAREKRAAAKRKPVECVTLNCTFDSMLDAAQATGITFSNISRVCLGERARAGGMVFRYI